MRALAAVGPGIFAIGYQDRDWIGYVEIPMRLNHGVRRAQR